MNGMSPKNERPVPLKATGDLVIEPLRPKRVSGTLRETERLLAALQVAVSTDLDLAKREILERIAAVETSVEAIAREMARRNDRDNAQAGGSDSP